MKSAHGIDEGFDRKGTQRCEVTQTMEDRLSNLSARENLSWKTNLVIMVGIALLSFYLMSHWIWRPISPDERAYLGWAMKLYKDGSYETPDGKPIVKVPPLYVHSLALFFKLFGPSTDTAQAVSLVFGCLGILLCYELGRRLWGWKVGLMASILLLVWAKGEYWRYSNRVLNEIPLGFFMLCAVYFLCVYLRRPSWWKAVGVGLSLGLGLLTKEFAVLILPVAGLTLVLAKEKWSRKLFHLGVALSVLFIVLLPWLVHVTEITGSPLGGIAQRGKGQAAEIIRDTKAWGIRPIEEWANMVRLYGKPAWLCQVALIAAMAHGAWRFFRNREAEIGILLLTVVVFLLTFGFFVALPLDLRRLVPLFPLQALLVAIFLKRLWSFVLEKAERSNLKIPASGRVAWVLFALFAINSLKPALLITNFEPFAVLSSKQKPYLFNEIQAAISCVPAGSTILSNYRYVLYFYLGGSHPVKALLTSIEGSKSSLISHKRHTGSIDSVERKLDEGDAVLYDFVFRGKRVVMTREFLQRRIDESGADYLIFFRTDHPKVAPKALEDFLMAHPERYVPVCQDVGYAVYRIKK